MSYVLQNITDKSAQIWYLWYYVKYLFLFCFFLINAAHTMQIRITRSNTFLLLLIPQIETSVESNKKNLIYSLENTKRVGQINNGCTLKAASIPNI